MGSRLWMKEPAMTSVARTRTLLRRSGWGVLVLLTVISFGQRLVPKRAVAGPAAVGAVHSAGAISACEDRNCPVVRSVVTASAPVTANHPIPAQALFTPASPASGLIFLETFEGTFPSGLWSLIGNPTWDDTNVKFYN